MVRLLYSLRFTRGVLVLLNVLFLLFGFTLLGFGIYLAASKKFDVAFFDDVSTQIVGGAAIEVAGIILIIAGIFTVLLSTFGCLGALLLNRLYLYLYGIILAILMLSKLAAFITTMSFRVHVRDKYESGLMKVFNDAYVNNETELVTAIEKLEKQFKCCGVIGYQDYDKINRSYPNSCCKNNPPCRDPVETGCASAITDWIWDEMPIFGGIIGVVIFLEMFGVIAAVSLGVAISHYTYGQIHSNL